MEILCEYCSTTFSTAIDLNNHLIAANHVDMKIYQCNRCSMNFSSAILLKFHQKSKLTHTQLNVPNDLDVPLTDKSNT